MCHCIYVNDFMNTFHLTQVVRKASCLRKDRLDSLFNLLITLHAEHIQQCQMIPLLEKSDYLEISLNIVVKWDSTKEIEETSLEI